MKETWIDTFRSNLPTPELYSPKAFQSHQAWANVQVITVGLQAVIADAMNKSARRCQIGKISLKS